MSLQTRSMERTSNNDKGPSSVQYRIFIEDFDSLVGSTLVDELRNDNENDINPHIIVGSGTNLPRGATAIVDAENTSILAQVVVDSDVIIFHNSVCQAEYAFKILKHAPFVSPKIFILLSPSSTWASTPLKERNENERASIVEGESEFPFLKKYSRYCEQDVGLRKYFDLRRHLECLMLACDKPNLHTYILTHGVLYGRGEEQLYDLFKTAWMNPEIELPIYGDGNNIIPMIHVADLCTLVNKIITLTPAQKYIFALDYDTMTQKKLVTTISQGIGKGLVKHIENHNNHNSVLSQNAWLKPTSIFDNDDEQYIDAKKNPIINWVCKEGLSKHMVKVRNEFKLYRGLDTVKVILIGGTASGKTYFGEQLAKHYKVPHILIKPLIQDVSQHQTELGELVRQTLQQVKEQLTAEALAIFEQERKKKKVPKGQPEPQFDASHIIPRLPDNVLIQVYQWRLQQNDAQNLGYVLDGFPKTVEQAQQLFYNVESNEEGGHQKQKTLNESLIPKGVIYFDQQDENLKERAKGLEQSRFSEDQVNKRLAAFRKNSEQLIEFLDQFEIAKLDANVTFQDLLSFISRKGEVMVLQDEEVDERPFIEEESKGVEEVQTPQPEKSEQKPPEKQEKPTKKKGDLNKSLNESRLSRDKQKLTPEQRQDMIRQQEKELLDTRSQPLRQYLADNVVPYLTEALIEICEKQPSDPLDYLANFLEQKGNQIQQIGQ